MRPTHFLDLGYYPGSMFEKKKLDNANPNEENINAQLMTMPQRLRYVIASEGAMTGW